VLVSSASFAREHCPKGINEHNFHHFPYVAFNRKDQLQHLFVTQAFGLPRVVLRQRFVPSSEGQVRAVKAGWGVSVLPELQVRERLERGELVNLVPRHALRVALYWHCWNLSSDVLDTLSRALREAAGRALHPPVLKGP
jgi:LysR family transcriptional regulator (chromosome initiation inhibitor)